MKYLSDKKKYLAIKERVYMIEICITVKIYRREKGILFKLL